MAKTDPRLAALKKAVENNKRSNKEIEERKYDPAKQAQGYETRMEASGVDVEEDSDSRNALEKALNLKPNQNALFDLFEVINRPQQALFGGIDSMQKGEGFLAGASEGLTGNKETNFGQILRTAGMSDRAIVGEVGFDDILGFAGDVMLDPLDIPLFGASKMVKIGGAWVDYGQALSKSDETVSALKTAIKSKTSALEQAKATLQLDKLKGAELVRANELVEKLPESLELDKLALKSAKSNAKQLKTMKRSRRNALQVAVSSTGTGVNKMLTFADGSIDKLLAKVDSLNATRLTNQTTTDLIKKTGEVFSYQKYYTGIKTGLANIFDWTKKFRKQGIDLTGSATKVRGAQMLTENQVQAMWTNLTEDLTMYKGEIFKHLKENNLYDEFLTTAMDGRTMDDLKKIYVGMSDSDIIDQVSDVKLQHLVMLNKEYGTKLFGTPAEIAGLTHQMNIDAMITDNSLLYNMGVSKEWKDLIEGYIDKHYKSWADQYFPNGDMFIEYSGNDKIITTFRFNEALDGGEAGEALNTLRAKMQRSKDLSDLNEVNFKDITDKYQKALLERQEMLEFKKNRDALVKAGVTISPEDNLFVPRGHAQYGEYDNLRTSMKTLENDKIKLQAELHGLTVAERTKERIKDIASRSKKIDKDAQKIASNIDGLKLKIGRPVDDLIKEENNLIKSIKSMYVTAADSNRVTENVDSFLDFVEAAEQARATHTLPRYITQEKIDQVSKFSQNEGFANYMSAVHQFQEDAIKLVNKNLKANYKFQDGFMTHVMTKEWLEGGVRRLEGKTEKNLFAASSFIGNSKTFGSRAYRESAFASNEMVKGYLDHLIATKSVQGEAAIKALTDSKNVKMFQDEANKSMAEFIRRAPKTSADAKMLHTVMNDVILGSLNDSSIIKPVVFEAGKKPLKARGYTQISKAALTEKLNLMADHVDITELTSNGKSLKDNIEAWLKESNTDFFEIDNNINRLIGRMGDETEASVFLKALDTVNNMFKRNKLLSIGFPMRNVAGNMSNLYLAGMSMPEVMSYSVRGRSLLKNGDALFKDITDEAIAKLTEKQLKDYEIYLEFMENGFAQVGNRIQDLAPDLKIKHRPTKSKYDITRAYDKVVEFNGKVNEAQDSMYRMAAYMWAKDNPENLFELGFDKPEQFVRNALFDFTDLSGVEQDVLRKAIPFYTFTKKNLGFQMRNLMQNPQKYNTLMKAFDSSWDMMDLSDEEIDAYSIENFWIPIPFKNEEGNYFTIKSSLPLGDMGEWISDPFRRLMSSMSPAVRAPFELATNTQTFSGMPIQEFKGQRGFQIPELDRRSEYMLGLTGLDVPIGVGADAVRTVGMAAKGEINSPVDFLGSAVGRGVVNEKDPVAIAQRQAYERLDTLENLMRYYKQEGVEIKTMAEINMRSKTNNTQAIINNLKAITKRG